jgi:hypothetical protein
MPSRSVCGFKDGGKLPLLKRETQQDEPNLVVEAVGGSS